MRRKFANPLAVSALTLLAGLLVSSACYSEEVIMFRGAPPSAKDLADIMFPEDGDQNEPGPMNPNLRVRGIRVNPSITGQKPEGTAAAFGFNIHFDFDSDQVRPESAVYLDRVAEMLNSPQAADRNIVIVGHTDATGSSAYNDALSKRRAIAVQTYLNQQRGIDKSRLPVIGKGENDPLPGRDPYDPENRRVEFHRAY